MKHKIGVIIPVVNCFHFTRPMVKSIKSKHELEIVLIDNGSTDRTPYWGPNKEKQMPNFHYFKDLGTTGLADSWNFGIKKALELGCDTFFLPNNDILLSPTTIDNLVEELYGTDAVLVSAMDVQSSIDHNPESVLAMETPYKKNPTNEHPHFSCFMINTETIEKVGFFDDAFCGAYFEDNDYHARIALANEKATVTSAAVFFHYGSRTLNDPTNSHIAQKMRDAFDRNKNLFKQKWGVHPVQESELMRKSYFGSPYNNKKLKLKDVGNNTSVNSLW